MSWWGVEVEVESCFKKNWNYNSNALCLSFYFWLHADRHEPFNIIHFSKSGYCFHSGSNYKKLNSLHGLSLMICTAEVFTCMWERKDAGPSISSNK